jgi:hypothetical protein
MPINADLERYLDLKFEFMNNKFEAQNNKIDAINNKLDALSLKVDKRDMEVNRHDGVIARVKSLEENETKKVSTRVWWIVIALSIAAIISSHFWK